MAATFEAYLYHPHRRGELRDGQHGHAQTSGHEAAQAAHAAAKGLVMG
jgi:hypothetical protein